MEKLAARNAAQVLDLLVARFKFERTGMKLYDGVIDKIERHGEPRYMPLLHTLRKHRGEEEEHANWLEEQIRALGGYPNEETDLSQLEAEEGSGIEKVILDGHQKVIHLLHALLAAELADNAGWDLLVKLASDAGDRAAKFAFARRLAEEAKHLLFLRGAIQRAADIEILGLSREMPASVGRAVARSLAKPIGFGALMLAAAGAVGGGLALTFRGRLG